MLFRSDSKVEKGTKVVFAPLDVNMDYADHAFRSALKMGQWGTVKWLHEIDEHTGGRVCYLTTAIWGPFAGQWRHQQHQLLGGLVEAVRLLTEALRRRMPRSVRQVAKKKDPAMVAMTTVLMRWPDRHLAVEYVTGHKIVSHVEASGVFRARGRHEIAEEELMTGFLGQEAVAYIDGLMSKAPRRDSEDIERLMAIETSKGYQGDRKSTRLNSSHSQQSRMPSSA